MKSFFFVRTTRDELLHAAFTTELTAAPGTHAEYSDIGFIILGVALERLADEPLQVFCQREVFGPLAMSHTTFSPANVAGSHSAHCGRPYVSKARYPRRGAGRKRHRSWRRRWARWTLLNCRRSCALCPLSAEWWLSHSSPRDGALFTRRESMPNETSQALGWDTPSSPSQSGKYFGPRSFGHLGYTGTSLWIDPDRQLSITLTDESHLARLPESVDQRSASSISRCCG